MYTFVYIHMSTYNTHTRAHARTPGWLAGCIHACIQAERLRAQAEAEQRQAEAREAREAEKKRREEAHKQAAEERRLAQQVRCYI